MKLRAPEALRDRPRKTMACPTANLRFLRSLLPQDGGVGANAECQRQDSDGRESRVLPEPAEGQTKIQDQTVHGSER